MNRRHFVKAILAGSQLRLQAEGPGQSLLYFVDGYHGGVRGHMPTGAWRDIVTRLQSTPDWKLCLEIEPASWARLAEEDPESLALLTQFLQAPASHRRVEMVGGTFAQPYGWAMSGESNIRQLVRGLAVIRESFPELAVDTYAVQEPCWASCLPQILVSLGFKAAVLKNPSTAWGGYSVGMDAETVNWIGPDGTVIRAVPRYACEELVDTWRTEAQAGSLAYTEKCIRHGIAHPTGMCFQDLGWAARPNVHGDHIRFVTWREYMQSVASRTTRDWRFGIEDIRCALPWGEKTLQTVTRQVRSAEHRLIVAEKMASLATIFCKQNYPHNELQQAWDKTLWSQHHDSWITATTRSGRDAWAFQVAAETWDAEAVCTDIIERSLDNLTRKISPAAGSQQGSFVHVFNTQAHDRHEAIEIAIASASGTKSIRVRDASGNIVLSQFDITRKYVGDQADRVRDNRHRAALEPGESVGAARLTFKARVPATGYAVYSVEDLVGDVAANTSPGATAVVQADGSVIIDTDLYRIRLNPLRGGTISSLFAKQLAKEFCDSGERCFHEFRGYFISDKAWQTSAAKPATLEVLENGPVRVTVAIRGSIASVPFQTVVSVVEGEPRIEFDTQFRFAQDTWIGDPWDIPPGERMTGRRRSEYDDRPKLLALFPVQLQNQKLYKSAAFDVCRSDNTDTFFQSWDAIKHNIIVDWVDVFDEKNDLGFALLSDHTTSYVHGEDHPLALVLGWGWDGGYWWGKCPLNGVQQSRYAVIPHARRWDKAQLWRQSTERGEPLLGRVSLSKREATYQQLARIASPGVYLTASYIDRGELFLRLFNAESDNTDHEIVLGIACKSVDLVELDGRMGGKLQATRFGNDGHKVTVTIPRFGFRTLRLSQFV